MQADASGLTDLLSPSHLRDADVYDTDMGLYVPGLSQTLVSNADDLAPLLHLANLHHHARPEVHLVWRLVCTLCNTVLSLRPRLVHIKVAQHAQQRSVKSSSAQGALNMSLLHRLLHCCRDHGNGNGPAIVCQACADLE